MLSQHNKAGEALCTLKEKRGYTSVELQDKPTYTGKKLEGVYSFDAKGIDSKEAQHKFK